MSGFPSERAVIMAIFVIKDNIWPTPSLMPCQGHGHVPTPPSFMWLHTCSSGDRGALARSPLPSTLYSIYSILYGIIEILSNPIIQSLNVTWYLIGDKEVKYSLVQTAVCNKSFTTVGLFMSYSTVCMHVVIKCVPIVWSIVLRRTQDRLCSRLFAKAVTQLSGNAPCV